MKWLVLRWVLSERWRCGNRSRQRGATWKRNVSVPCFSQALWALWCQAWGEEDCHHLRLVILNGELHSHTEAFPVLYSLTLFHSCSVLWDCWWIVVLGSGLEEKNGLLRFMILNWKWLLVSRFECFGLEFLEMSFGNWVLKLISDISSWLGD